MTRVALAGPMGSGKSTVGRLLADRLRVSFADLDATVGSISEIFAREGEAGFRARERTSLRTLAEGEGVIALGGGTLVDPSNVETLSGWRIVVLMARVETLLARVGHDPNRPLAMQIPELFVARAESYRSAGPQVWTDDLDLDEVARRVESLC